ncbi:MAG: NAD(P)-dependent alcohol dehydrogenase [Deferrisomatales bacterium]|nr:NAD(P)-dependent alcohol dehydrogenase [Deferrisomatales bacterium]
MKAILYTRYGPPEVLHVGQVEKPSPGDHEVLIRVRAAEATKSDCEMRSFEFPVKWFWLPLRFAFGLFQPKRQVLGGYFSGVVASVGTGVSRLSAGDEVFGAARLKLGAYAEHLCLPDDYTLVPKPANLSFEEAAAVPLGGLNALHFLRRANIRKGETVLVNGAGGSIGTFGVQIAKALGAEVTAVDSAPKEDLLRRIGADHFIDYAKEDFTRGSQAYDVIFSMVARTPYSACLKALRPGGRYLLANPKLSDMLRAVLPGRRAGKTAVFAFARELPEELLALKEMLEDGAIRPVVDGVFPMERAAEAHRRVESEQRLGPVVISIGNAD